MGAAAPVGSGTITPGASPAVARGSSPVSPGVTVTSTDPVIPVPETDSGAATATGRTAMGLRATTSPLVHESDPVANVSRAASVRVNVTV